MECNSRQFGETSNINPDVLMIEVICKKLNHWNEKTENKNNEVPKIKLIVNKSNGVKDIEQSLM